MGIVLDLVTESLECLSDTTVNVNDMIFEKFYHSSPESEQLMTHMDELTRGKMLEEVIRLLLVKDLASESEYLVFELKTHKWAYSVVHNMYRILFDALLEAVREAAGNAWRAEYDSAWQSRIDELVAAFDEHAPESI